MEILGRHDEDVRMREEKIKAYALLTLEVDGSECESLCSELLIPRRSPRYAFDRRLSRIQKPSGLSKYS
jgi:hypothetical protein